jgi:hypothetical protein
LPLLPVAPGLGLASTEATLAAWRDGFPATYEPLLPVRAFGAHAPGLPLLAADVSLLSGLPPYRAVVLMALAAWGLLAVAFAMLVTRTGRPHLAPLAGLGTAAVVALAVTQGIVAGSVGLATALGLAALGLLVRPTGRAAAVAAGLLIGAAFTVEATAGLAFALATAIVAGRSRALLAVCLAVVLGAPRLATALSAWSAAEVRAARAELGPPRRDPVPDGSAIRAMAWLRENTHRLARVCVAPGGPGRFVPAVALRTAVPAEVPAVYRDEAAALPSSDRCSYVMTFDRFAPASQTSIPTNDALSPGPRIVFQDGATIVREEPQL